MPTSPVWNSVRRRPPNWEGIREYAAAESAKVIRTVRFCLQEGGMPRFRHGPRERHHVGLPGSSAKPRRLPPSPERVTEPLLIALGLAAGAVLAFFLDPQNGRRRRKLVLARATGAVRRRKRRLTRHAHYEARKMIGVAHAVMHRNRTAPDLDDVGLVHKVESELFRDRTLPKGQISINADRGTVVLRGELEDEQQAIRIERATRKIHGVRDVENLLHKPGMPAPPSHPHPNPNHPTTRPAA
jgi:hypothetical protein